MLRTLPTQGEIFGESQICAHSPNAVFLPRSICSQGHVTGALHKSRVTQRAIARLALCLDPLGNPTRFAQLPPNVASSRQTQVPSKTSGMSSSKSEKARNVPSVSKVHEHRAGRRSSPFERKGGRTTNRAALSDHRHSRDPPHRADTP